MTYTKNDLITAPVFDLTKFELGKAYSINIASKPFVNLPGILYSMGTEYLKFVCYDDDDGITQVHIVPSDLQDGDSIAEMVIGNE